MTSVTEIITDAYRQSNLLAISVLPTTAQQTEALRYLNRIVKSVFGNEVGDQLYAFPIGRLNISRPSGYPWYGEIPFSDWFVPKNVRLMLNTEQAQEIWLHPSPDDGSRFAVSNPSNNLASFPITVRGNGRLIEGSESIILETDGMNQEWFFRQDIADWLKYAPLVLIDTFPFPEEFDDFFITMLAMRLNPAYGTSMDEQSQMVLQRTRSQFRARYQAHIEMPSELALLRMPKVAADRDNWKDIYGYYDPTSAFNRGFPW